MNKKKTVISFSLQGSPHLPPSQKRIEAGQAVFSICAVFVLVTAVILFVVWKPSAGWNVQNVGLSRLLCALPPAILLSFLVGKNAFRPRDMLRHIQGREYDDGSDAAYHLAAEMRKQIALDANRRGIQIAPNVPMSIDRETKGIFCVGAPGGGKTVVLKSLIAQAVIRGDRVVIFDAKGDFREMLLSMRKKFYFFAPWHKRTNAIDFAADLKTADDAREFAARIIQKPTSGDVNWALGAQQLLTGLIVSLQSEGNAWTVAELAANLNLPLAEMRATLCAHYLEGARVIEADGKATDSYLSMLRTCSAPLLFIARAFQNVRRDRTISLTAWARSERPARRVIIIGGSKRYATLMQACAQFAIGTIANEISDLPDSRDRKVWFFLDELPQLGRVDDLMMLVEFCRSKGVRVVIGTQDLAQIESLYSRERATALQTMMSTKIICNVSGGSTADALSKSLGTRTVERPNVSVNFNAQGRSSSISWQRESLPLVPASVLTAELGKDATGIYAIADILNTNAVYKLKWPFTHYATEDDATHVKAEEIDPIKAAAFAAIEKRIESEKIERQRLQSAQQTQHKGYAGETVVTDSLTSKVADSHATGGVDPCKDATASVAMDAIAGNDMAHIADTVVMLADPLKQPLNGGETHKTYRKGKSAEQLLKDLEAEL